MDNKPVVSSRLKQLRKQRNITQADLARIIGIGQTAVANYENGKRFPDETKLVRIADFFEISLDYLMGRDFRTPPHEAPRKSGFYYSSSDLSELTDDFMNRAQQSGSTAVELILKLRGKGYSEEQISLDLLQPALVQAGTLWAEGLYNEAMEHQLSMSVMQSINTMKTLSVKSEKTRGRFTAMPVTGELHNIGLSMISRFLEIDGWDSYFLGSAVPAVSLLEFNRVNRIDLVLVSATLNENVDALCSIIKAVKSVEMPPAVMAGGKAASMNKDRILSGGADYVFNSISETMEKVGEIEIL